jgi:hypothetical protein
LKEILENSRPFFAQVAFEYISKISDVYDVDEQDLVKIIDEISTEVANEASKRKYFFTSEYAALGQYSIFKNISYEQNEFLPSDLINHHYASLVSPSNESGNFILDQDGRVNRLKWNACSKYPSPEKDILLHLSLPGCKDFCPFISKDEKAVPFLRFILEWKREGAFRNRFLKLSENSNQASNDGLFLGRLRFYLYVCRISCKWYFMSISASLSSKVDLSYA